MACKHLRFVLLAVLLSESLFFGYLLGCFLDRFLGFSFAFLVTFSIALSYFLICFLDRFLDGFLICFLGRFLDCVLGFSQLLDHSVTISVAFLDVLSRPSRDRFLGRWESTWPVERETKSIRIKPVFAFSLLGHLASPAFVPIRFLSTRLPTCLLISYRLYFNLFQSTLPSYQLAFVSRSSSSLRRFAE